MLWDVGVGFGRRRGLTAILCLLSFALAPAASAAMQEEQDDPRQRVAQAVEEIQKGNFERAIEDLEQLLEEYPDLPQAHYFAGMAQGRLGRNSEAFDHVVRATELQPGFGEAHRLACFLAYQLGDRERAWEEAILAAQAGVDMEQAFTELRAVTDPPDDFEARMAAPRVFLGGVDAEALLQRDDPAFVGGATQETRDMGADTRGSGGDPTASDSRGTASGLFTWPQTGSGSSTTAQLQGELTGVLRQFGQGLSSSSQFAVVPRLELADFVLQIKVDDVSENDPRLLVGFVKLFDYDSDEEIYSRPLRLTDIGSVSDLRNEVARYIGYLEIWLQERQGGN